MIETWLSYSLSDLLMFSPRVYYRQMELANASAWPLHVAMLMAGLLVAFTIHAPSPARNRICAVVLAVAWASSCWFFVINAFAQIHWAGWYMATLFLAETASLIVIALLPAGLTISRPTKLVNLARTMMVAVTVLAYPGLALLSGRNAASSEVFGIAADPTAVVTLMIVASAATGWQLLLAIVPWLWLAFSASALWAMGALEVWALLVFVVTMPVLILARALTSGVQKT